MLSRDSVFKKILYSEIDKKFDGERNVLIVSLLNSCSEVNSNLEDSLNNKSRHLQSTYNLNDLLWSFNFAESNECFYPQIYIPEHQLSGNFKIITVAFNGDETQNAIIGNTLSDDNNSRIINISVDSNSIENDEVWIISLNESVNSYGLIPIDDTIMSPRSGFDARISFTKVKDLKESWFGGASELSVSRFVTWCGGVNPNTFVNEALSIPNFTNQGTKIWSVLRKNKNQWVGNGIPFTLKWWWNTNEPNILVAVFFEYDVFPAGVKSRSQPFGPINPTILFQSSNSPYFTGYFYKEMVLFHRDIFNTCGSSVGFSNNFTIEDNNSLGVKFFKN